MKRLTTWTSMDGKAKLIVTDGTLSDKLIEQIAIQRLAEYEDTGLTPKEIEDMVSVREITPEAEYAIDKHADNLIQKLDELITKTDEKNELQRYKEAEEQGLLVRLPCKVGDTVYDILEFVERTPCPEMYEYYADYIGIGKSDDGRTVISIDCTDFYMDDFGKIVFTSREAAEKALEEVCRKNT